MAACLASNKPAALAARTCTGVPALRCAPAARQAAVTRAIPVELLAAAGDVEAPLVVPIVAAVVVTVAVTFAVPAYLNRGQSAFEADSQQKAALKAKITTKGKAAAGKKTARR